MQKILIKNDKGMSLLEVMMAASILAVISLGVMQLSKNMNKTSRTATKAFDIESVMREIQNHMNNKDNCSATVYGANGGTPTDTILTGLKSIEMDSAQATYGAVKTHPRIRVSTMASPRYVANGMIISGMFLRRISDTDPGANYELHITFMKSVRAGQGATKAQDATYGQNLTTRKIPLTLDNCSRYVAVGNSASEASGQCTGNGGQPIGNAVGVYSDYGGTVLEQSQAAGAGISKTQYFIACSVCTTRTTVNGCL